MNTLVAVPKAQNQTLASASKGHFAKINITTGGLGPPVSYQRSVKTQELPKNRDKNCPRIEGGCAFSMSSLLSSVRAARQREAARTTLAVAMPTAGRSSPVWASHTCDERGCGRGGGGDGGVWWWRAVGEGGRGAGGHERCGHEASEGLG